MTSNARRMHLVRRKRDNLTACGLTTERWTTDLSLVTCKVCRGTLLMADTESHSVFQRSQRGKKK